MKKLMISLALASALAACGQAATTTEQTPAEPAPVEAPQVAPTDPVAGPSGLDAMTWRFDEAGRTTSGASRPRLMYASYGSEGMALNLQCDPGANRAYAILARGEQKPSWPFTLRSGSVSTQLSGSGVGESEVAVTATAPLDAPALAAFRNSGALTLVEGQNTVVMDAINAEERQAIAQFFERCG